MKSFHSPKKQAGVTLVMGTVVLIVLGALGITSLRSIIAEERMLANSYDRNVAFQAAEAALLEAENRLISEPLPLFDGTITGYHLPNLPDSDSQVWETDSWYTIDYDSGVVGGSASYIVEQLSKTKRLAGGVSIASDVPEEAARFYRISAYGAGPSGDSRVLLQVIYQR
jgi:type IV pilus assembly protein PilX